MSGAKDSGKNPLRYLALLLAVVFVVSALLLGMNIWERQQGMFSDDGEHNQQTVIDYNGNEYVLRDELRTILVMGLDSFEEPTDTNAYTNNQQADFLVLLVLDDENESWSAIHLNRDTMTPVNVLGVAGQKIDTKTMQLALAHAYGNGQEVSCNNTADAVSKLLYGVKVDHYISLTMDAVALFNDMVGGVEVTVLDDFTGIDDSLIQGETVTLKGDQALTYVRSRQGVGDGTNVGRMERQRQYIEALIEQTRRYMEEDPSFSAGTAKKLAEYMVTDRSVNQLQKLMDKMAVYRWDGIRTIEGKSEIGKDFMEFYPDEQSLKQQVIEVLGKPKDE